VVYSEQLSPAYFPPPRSYQQEVLQEMYESPELFNEGLSSFEYPLYIAEDEELDYFLGGLIRSVGRAAGGVVKAAGDVAKTVGKGVSTLDKIVPVSTLLNMTPMGMAVRAGLGAVQAAAEGRNVFQGAIRSLASDPVSRFYIDTGMAAARGENILKAAQKAAQAGIGDVRKSLQFAAMVAPFVPGIGSGVAAALSAANALAAGQPISEALIAAARGAVPGGAIAQLAFDTAMNLAKGKNIGEALLNSARSRLPGGPAAQAAFDAALALAKGKNIQDAAFAAAGRLLPPSPYAANALSFVNKVVSGQNIQRAALSTVGNVIYNRIHAQAGPILPRIPGRIRQPLVRRPFRELQNVWEYEGPKFLDPSWTPIEKALGKAMSYATRNALYVKNDRKLDDYAADFAVKAKTREEYYFHSNEFPNMVLSPARPYVDPYANIRTKKPQLYQAALKAEAEFQKYSWFRDDYQRLNLAAGAARLVWDGTNLYVQPDRPTAVNYLGKAAEVVVDSIRDIAVEKAAAKLLGSESAGAYVAIVIGFLQFLHQQYGARDAQDLYLKQDRERRDEAFRIKLRFFTRLKTRGGDPVVAPSKLEEAFWGYQKVYYERMKYQNIEEMLRQGLDPDNPNQRIQPVMRPA
jgi:hypothetical protein